MKDENIERLRKLGESLEKISHFTDTEHRYGSPWFSREFLLKNILGLTDEEYDQNEKLLIDAAAKKLVRTKKIESLSKIKSVEEDFEEKATECCAVDSSSF